MVAHQRQRELTGFPAAVTSIRGAIRSNPILGTHEYSLVSYEASPFFLGLDWIGFAPDRLRIVPAPNVSIRVILNTYLLSMRKFSLNMGLLSEGSKSEDSSLPDRVESEALEVSSF